jgi:tyrosine-specific transport protein
MMNMRSPLCLLTSCILATAFQHPRHLNNSPPILRKRSVHVFLSNNNNEEDNEGGGGSIAGASLLFAGTAVGAGMIALPAETLNAGFIPSVSGLSACWMFTYVTSMLTLEASWLACTQNEEESGDYGGGFLSISKMSLGVPGEVITAALFWFLLTSIVVAYTSEGGQLIAQFAKEFTDTTTISPTVGSLLFASCFASFSIAGTSRVDAVNRIFVIGLVATFIGIIVSISPFVQVSNLISQSDWSAVYPAGISIGILSFGAQNVVPTILQYLNYDPAKTQKAILLGSLIPLVLYTIWEAVFLGIIDASNVDSNSMEVVNVLGQIGGKTVSDLVELFSICAIGSSMAGASVSLVDFFVDAFGLLSKDSPRSKTGNSRTLAAALALGPPVIISYLFPDVFLTALEEAGLLGGVSLYGILPALCLLSLRSADDSSETNAMPGRLGGGKSTLFTLLGVSTALILPEIVHVGRVVTDKLQ